MEGYLGQVIFYAGMRIPLNWALCNGQELEPSQYPALYSIIGTLYGGDGVHTFALPKLTNTEDAALKYIICCEGEYPQFY